MQYLERRLSPAWCTVASLGVINKSVLPQRKGVAERTSKRSLSRHQRPTELRELDLFFFFFLSSLPLYCYHSSSTLERQGMSETERFKSSGKTFFLAISEMLFSISLLISYLPSTVCHREEVR